LLKSVIFVGSSSEAKDLIGGLDLNLDGKVSVSDWSNTSWPLSRSALHGVEQLLDNADFAAFILSADDVAVIRGEAHSVPRDNVLLELGMAYGRLGRDRTFILAPRVGATRGPSDLAGISVIEYEHESDSRSTMRTPANRLWETIERLGPRDRSGANGSLQRGDTTRIDMIADGALYVFHSRNSYAGELRQAVLNGEKVPAKVQFAQPDGGRHWLSLCRSTKYQYFINARTHLKENVGRLTQKIHDVAGTTAIDLVSLGSGDGSKDDILLRSLTTKLADHEYIYYYPIDISDILLVDAVRYVSQHGLDRKRFRCKPVLGDFTNLSSLQGIISHRPNTNLFSVLGNVIGSFDESDILASVAGAMEPGDFVLLESNIGDPEGSIALLQDDAASQWDLSTLDAMGIARDSCDLHQERREGVSDVPGTQTLVSYAVPRDQPASGDGTASKYMLSAMHHYDFEQLQTHVCDELDIVLIDAVPGEGVCLLLGQRQSRATQAPSRATSNGSSG
jgi:hypothetical protein